jgi:L-aminopeptidase/D-esterase-like protein
MFLETAAAAHDHELPGMARLAFKVAVSSGVSARVTGSSVFEVKEGMHGISVPLVVAPIIHDFQSDLKNCINPVTDTVFIAC